MVPPENDDAEVWEAAPSGWGGGGALFQRQTSAN